LTENAMHRVDAYSMIHRRVAEAGFKIKLGGRVFRARAGFIVRPCDPWNALSRAFYEDFGFVASPSDPFHLFELMKDLRHIVGS